MGVDMKVNILMIRKKEIVTFIGQIEESIREAEDDDEAEESDDNEEDNQA